MINTLPRLCCGLVFYGASPQYPITGSALPVSHFTFPVTITGKA